MAKINKQVTNEFSKNGDKLFLLGIRNNIYYWLHEPTWDCDWYWGLGYIKTYTTTNSPMKSKDIESHEHFDYMFMYKNNNIIEEMKLFFDDIVLSESELYLFAELMNSMYICRKFADMTNNGGTNYTKNPCKEILENKKMSTHVNKIMLPALFKEIEKLLSPNVE